MGWLIRHLTLLGCALLSLNLVGTDPSDVIFGLAGGFILIFSPMTIFFGDMRTGGRLALAITVALYAL